ncbi:MAG: radical SAM protein [Methanospirillaceae archaeon]|nr:radical SAM protein [Methanospirillaceae archaeon]
MNTKKSVRPWWSPPSLVFRQTLSLLYLALLLGWRKMPVWVIKYGFSCLPGASGAKGMGCIGFPSHPVIELTDQCNFSCIHCHATGCSGSDEQNQLTTTEIFTLLDNLAEVPQFRMVAFTGGEPFLRNDLFSILNYAQKLGFSQTIATNGSLITKEIAQKLKDLGVAIVAISIDAPDEELHDRIRRTPGAFKGAKEAISHIRAAGIPVHINCTIAAYNAAYSRDLISLTDELKAAICIVYQLVPVGRGREIAELKLDTEKNQQLLQEISESQREVTTVIEPVAGPQYWANLLFKAGIRKGILLSIAEHLFFGCSAGRGFIYIKPNGDVLPCPFLPITCGNIRETPFKEIYENSPVLKALRSRDALKGACGACRYQSVCGGCRGRAYAVTGNYLDEDPACFLREQEP